MILSRRDFFRICSKLGGALALGGAQLARLDMLLAGTDSPVCLWLQGSGCSGCSVSFLNRIAADAPRTAADVLLSSVNLAFHPTVMAASGALALETLERAESSGNYLLVVEGGVPTAFDGYACIAWSKDGAAVTFLDAVTRLAAKASSIVCVGTCAAWGGIPAAPPNPAGVRGVGAVTGRKTLNIGGCPPHPDWIVWGIANALLGPVNAVDSYGRPTTIYARNVHDLCPRRRARETDSYGQDGFCLRPLGCKGETTRGSCPSSKWNNAQNWCVQANAPCIGCTNPTFAAAALRTAPKA